MLDANQLALYLAITLAGIATALIPAYLVGRAVVRKRNRAMAATAEALIRAHQLDVPARPGEERSAYLARLARLRAASQGFTPPRHPADTNPIPRTPPEYRGARPLPAGNPGPSLRPHPVQGIRTAAPAPAYVIPPAIDPTPPAGISTADTPDAMGAAVIHSMTLPIGGGEQAGEFAGAGASGSWSSDTGSSPATIGD